jgi:hypothetical protein
MLEYFQILCLIEDDVPMFARFDVVRVRCVSFSYCFPPSLSLSLWLV